MSDAPEAKQGGMSPLRIILFLILGLMIVALVYDWYVAKPAADEAYKIVEKLVSESAAKSAKEGQTTKEDVQSAIGREPTSVADKDWYLVEEYHWIRGLPWRSYYIIVIYNKKKDGKTFTLANVELNQPLEEISIPGGPAKPPEILPGDDDAGQGQPTEADPAQTEGDPTSDGDVSPPTDDDPAGDDPTSEEPPAETPPAEESPDPAPPAEEPPAEEPPAEEPPAETPPADEDSPAEEPSADDPPTEETPPADDTPAEDPPADDTPADDSPADETPAETPAAN